MRSTFFLAILALAACSKTADTLETDTDVIVDDTDADTDTDTDSDTDTDTDTDTQADCTATIKGVSPIDGAINIAVDSNVTVTFSKAVTETDFTLSVEGVTGKATLSGDGKSATFDPNDDLEQSTAYTIDASVCDDSVQTTTFTTVDGPIEPETLEGRTYALDMSKVTWEKPALASAFTGAITAQYVLTEAVSFDASANTMDAIGAIGELDGTDIVQTPCLDTIPYDNADFSGNPTFVAGPTTMSLDTDYGVVTMEEFTVTATFASGGDELIDIDITGNVDTRPLDDAAGFDVCSASSTFGEPCVKCSDGVKKCLPTEILSDSAPWVPDLIVDPALSVCM